jgi:hypothetical protein
MNTQTVLSEPLAEVCYRRCSRCLPGDGDAAPRRIPVLLDETGGGPPGAVPKYRITLPYPRCERCEFLLLMQAIERLIPAEDRSEWLKQPNMDLGGLRPVDCIDAGVYEPVFMALFFLDPCGPVS